jgi:antitoxin component of RelBE/YafQ-DinJ toxin-antitoxin module
MRTQRKDKYLHIRVDEEIKAKFLDKCGVNCVTPSKLIRRFIEEYIKNEEKN